MNDYFSIGCDVPIFKKIDGNFHEDVFFDIKLSPTGCRP